MELKLIIGIPLIIATELLIVPYGIETMLYEIIQRTFHLLIVPYGIETSFGDQLYTRSTLLIVPYGIETDSLPGIHDTIFILLIVPYGIETSLAGNKVSRLPDF